MAKKYVDGLLVDTSEADAAAISVDAENSDANAAWFLRSKRDALLAQTDWWAVSDRTMTSDMQSYRQALRDIPAQAGFPTNVTWPTKP